MGFLQNVCTRREASPPFHYLFKTKTKNKKQNVYREVDPSPLCRGNFKGIILPDLMETCLPSLPLTFRDWFRLHPHANTFSIFFLSSSNVSQGNSSLEELPLGTLAPASGSHWPPPREVIQLLLLHHGPQLAQLPGLQLKCKNSKGCLATGAQKNASWSTKLLFWAWGGTGGRVFLLFFS